MNLFNILKVLLQRKKKSNQNLKIRDTGLNFSTVHPVFFISSSMVSSWPWDQAPVFLCLLDCRQILYYWASWETLKISTCMHLSFSSLKFSPKVFFLFVCLFDLRILHKFITYIYVHCNPEINFTWSWYMIFFFFCSEFCHTLKWNSHGFTCVPHPNPPSHLPLHPIPLGLPSAPGPSACLMHPTWAGDLFHPR